ncbi:TauD/TfdA family dioxygenase [Streptomyces sp. NPDC005538]|uniref:TauD/TfdA family dioxygenase n=1 Tax=unclassified Streptomyces TaxID=2593676 RepID=UPI0033BBF52F
MTDVGAVRTGPGADPRREPGHLAEARRSLRARGWAYLTEAGFTDGTVVDRRRLLDLARCFGTPSDHDAGAAVWPVRARRSGTADTFSLRTGPAPLHTDAAYSPQPEDVVCLFTVRPAADGGHSRLLPAREAILGLPGGTLAELRSPVWRWSTPGVFRTPERRVAGYPVLEGADRMRWRSDNLLSAGRCRDFFAAHVERHPAVVELPSLPDSVLIVDNRTVLHGRTAFDDPDRLLYRVRLRRPDPAPAC